MNNPRIAQSGRAPALGAGGRRFESSCADHLRMAFDARKGRQEVRAPGEAVLLRPSDASRKWGCSSDGRAPALQAGCRGFEPRHFHHAAIAQLVEHSPCKGDVAGSIPCWRHHEYHTERWTDPRGLSAGSRGDHLTDYTGELCWAGEPGSGHSKTQHPSNAGGGLRKARLPHKQEIRGSIPRPATSSSLSAGNRRFQPGTSARAFLFRPSGLRVGGDIAADLVPARGDVAQQAGIHLLGGAECALAGFQACRVFDGHGPTFGNLAHPVGPDLAFRSVQCGQGLAGLFSCWPGVATHQEQAGCNEVSVWAHDREGL